MTFSRSDKGNASTTGNSSRPEPAVAQSARGRRWSTNSKVSSDQEISFDNEEQLHRKDLPEEDTRSVLSFSISHAQARLASPLTLAAEKAVALESLEGGGLFDGWCANTSNELGMKNGHAGRAESGMRHPFLPPPDGDDLQRLPSPWHSTPRLFQRSDVTKNALREAPRSTRPRASSGPSERGGWRILPFTLPSMPSLPKSPSFPSLGFHASKPRSPSCKGTVASKANSSQSGSGSSKTPWGNIMSSTWSIAQPKDRKPVGSLQTRHHSSRSLTQLSSQDDRVALEPQLEPSLSTHPFVDRPRQLRRARSDQSLDLRRSLSGVSSLGDDTRFESVHSQVNSRFKAIRDSFQDSSFTSIATLAFNPMKRLELQALSDVPRDLKGMALHKRNPSAGAMSLRPMMGEQELYKAQTSLDPRLRPVKFPTSWLPDALDKLTGDIVIMGGYRGSVLRSAKYPHRQVWVPLKVGLNLRKVDLEVGLNPEDEEMVEDTIVPSGMLTHVGPIDISRRLIKRLRKCENALNGKLRVWDYGYDWRLSPHILSRKLVAFLKDLPSNASRIDPTKRGALVIAHSLGGLITRHAVNRHPELFSGVLYAGTPQSCINILGPFRNGDEVLLSSRVLTAQVNFTLRTSFVLLPEDGRCFIDKRSKEEYRVDFFDVDSWIQYRFSPCIAPPLPSLDRPVSGLGGLVGSISGSFPSLPLLRNQRSSFTEKVNAPATKTTDATQKTDTTNALRNVNDAVDPIFAPQMASQPLPAFMDGPGDTPIGSANVTIRPEDALAYLRRTLDETLRFKKELHFRPEHAQDNAYPPFAVLYGKSLPTVNGVKVLGRDGIRRADAYDDLIFASGDGVCLAKQAMLPEGYEVVKNGRVSSDRSHITLLGDLEVVGRCICAILEGRNRGIGLGFE